MYSGGTPERPVTIVTGATGFVGGELIKRLLADSDRQLVCPVRANTADHAQERGADRLREIFGSDADRYGDRVIWVRGDLEEQRLGWSEDTWTSVAARTVEIFHCAASISFDLPLDEAHRINVEGTQHMHQLAVQAHGAHGSFSRFHHVSTAYVSGRRSGRVNAHHLPGDRESAFRNTYERTKARAERYLRSQASPQVPITIHRPSIVAGNTVTGETDCWNVLYVPMKMIAKGVLPVFTAGGRELVDSIGVDYVVRAMIAFAAIDTAPLEAHHLTAGPTAFTTTDVLATTSARAAAHDDFTPSRTKILSPLRWAALQAGVQAGARLPKRAGSIRTKARLARRGIDKCAVYLPYTRVDTIFDTSEEHAALEQFGITMPNGIDYLNLVIDYALASNFGRHTVPADQMPGIDTADDLVVNLTAEEADPAPVPVGAVAAAFAGAVA